MRSDFHCQLPRPCVRPREGKGEGRGEEGRGGEGRGEEGRGGEEKRMGVKAKITKESSAITTHPPPPPLPKSWLLLREADLFIK